METPNSTVQSYVEHQDIPRNGLEYQHQKCIPPIHYIFTTNYQLRYLLKRLHVWELASVLSPNACITNPRLLWSSRSLGGLNFATWTECTGQKQSLQSWRTQYQESWKAKKISAFFSASLFFAARLCKVRLSAQSAFVRPFSGFNILPLTMCGSKDLNTRKGNWQSSILQYILHWSVKTATRLLGNSIMHSSIHHHLYRGCRYFLNPVKHQILQRVDKYLGLSAPIGSIILCFIRTVANIQNLLQ